VTFADLQDAYWNADRFYTSLCWMDTYKPMYDEDGERLCYQSGAPLNGEATAGADFHIWRDARFESVGAHQSITCLGTFHIEADGCHATAITCVDDFLIKETDGNEKKLTMRMLQAFADAMGGWSKVKHHDRPNAFKGYGMEWSRDNRVVSLHMTPQVEALAHRYIPEVFEDKVPPGVVTGGKLCKLIDSLAMPSPRPLVMPAHGKAVQEITGSAKFIERGVMPRVSRHVHGLARVLASPPPDALVVAVAYIMYQNRYDCVTYGGDGLTKRILLKGGLYCDLKLEKGAPSELESHADTTTGACPVYAYAVTYNGGVIAHGVKKIAGLVPSSCLSECKGSTYASEWIEVARNALIAFGHPQQSPSLVGTDNAANLSIAMGTATPARVKPDLAKWASLKDRIARKLMVMAKVDTAMMPVDFLTKWLKKAVAELQRAYLVNARHAVWPA
jgi:hypothetical protein